jgi:hypothetical protein
MPRQLEFPRAGLDGRDDPIGDFLLLVVGFHVRCLQNVIKKRNWGRWQVDATIL